MTGTLEKLVADQFGPQAAAYVASAVHSSGADLDWIEAHLEDRSDAAFLDLGCGGGHVSYRAAPRVSSVTACDLSPDMLRAVEATASERGIANLRTVLASAERLPFTDAAFDIVGTRYSAHHWGDLDQALREAARVMKSGGLFLLADAAAPAHPLLDTYLQAIEVLRDPSHVRDRSIAEWVATLGRAGFRIEEVRSSRVRLEFASWVERIRTSEVAVAAIRDLQSRAPEEVRRHFGIETDGSFQLDTVWIAAAKM